MSWNSGLDVHWHVCLAHSCWKHHGVKEETMLRRSHIGFRTQRAVADGAKACVRVSAVIDSPVPILSMCSNCLNLAVISSHKARWHTNTNLLGCSWKHLDCWRHYLLVFLFLCMRLNCPPTARLLYSENSLEQKNLLKDQGHQKHVFNVWDEDDWRGPGIQQWPQATVGALAHLPPLPALSALCDCRREI